MKDATNIVITKGDEGYIMEVNDWDWVTGEYERRLYAYEETTMLFHRLVEALGLQYKIEIQVKIKEE